MAQLAGRVALVTGAGSGIGRAAALLLAREGARVAALGRTLSELESAVAEIEDAGGEGLAIRADIADVTQIRGAIEQAVDRWGRLDIVVANAGVNGVWAPLEELEPDEWESTIRINLTGTFLTVKYAVPYLKQQGGAVTIVSSVNGTRNFSNTGATAYSCSKAG
ncbi:MAG TPA: SDR family NAD(P)-dependent oxidoreductase, partial [Thermomicrobiales bacterium]|nr:SDR family NAD(P)-dependent oxidoreductase [Thermomicrobiales bacterium]